LLDEFLGGATKNRQTCFAFAMIVGVITGTYSSIFIASPVYILLKKHGHRFGMAKK